MKCKNCGFELAENDKFCNNCGCAVENQGELSQQELAQQGCDANKVLIKGILGLALAELPIPGLIFSNQALKMVKQDMKNGIAITGKKKVGRYLAIAGKIIGISMAVFWAIYIFIVLAAISWELL